MLIQPSPKLLALPDPYDPAANGPYHLHDAVLFNGKYYIYFGPAPAAIVAAGCAVIGKSDPAFGDEFLVLPLIFGTTVLAAILILQSRKAFFPDQPPWTAAIFILSLGLGTPVLYTLARSAIYEAAIAAGQFFLLAGILAAWFGLAGPRAKTPWMIAAGICVALGAGSRFSLAPATGAICLLTVWQMFRAHISGSLPPPPVFRGRIEEGVQTNSPRPAKDALRASLREPPPQPSPGLPEKGERSATPRLAPYAALLIPLIAAAILLAWYNFARFHSITEFGLRYQLAERNQHAKPLSEFSSPRYVVFNLYRYLLALPAISTGFPFITAPSGMTRFAENFNLPASFGFESVVGIVWSQPLLLLAPLAAAAPWWKRLRPVAARLSHRSRAIWLTLSLTAAVVLGFFPALTIEGSTMRYLLDMIPACTVLAALGMWWIMALAGPARAKWIAAALAIFAALQCVMGLLLGLSGYYQHFATFNPKLYHTMASWFGAS